MGAPSPEWGDVVDMASRATAVSALGVSFEVARSQLPPLVVVATLSGSGAGLVIGLVSPGGMVRAPAPVGSPPLASCHSTWPNWPDRHRVPSPRLLYRAMSSWHGASRRIAETVRLQRRIIVVGEREAE